MHILFITQLIIYNRKTTINLFFVYCDNLIYCNRYARR